METSDKMLEKVRKLIAKAEGTDSAAEAEVYLEKASALMLQHSIDEAMLEMTRPAEKRIKPEALEYITVVEEGSPIKEQLVDLSGYIADQFNCRIVFFGLKRGGATSRVMATVVGFPSDLRSFQTLFTALQLDLASRLLPKPDVNKSFDENVYDLHEAGVKWREIANLMNRTYTAYLASGDYSTAGWKPELMRAWRQTVRVSDKHGPDVLVPWPDGHRLINAYRRHCKAIGEQPGTIQSPVTYQRNFAAGYVQRVGMRMMESRMKAEEQSGAGTALVLRSESLDEKVEEMFPKMGTAPKRKDVRYDAKARQAGRKAGDQADLGGQRMGQGKRGELS